MAVGQEVCLLSQLMHTGGKSIQTFLMIAWLLSRDLTSEEGKLNIVFSKDNS